MVLLPGDPSNPSQAMQIQGFEEVNKGLQQHASKLEGEVKELRVEAEQQVSELQARAATAEGHVKRLEVEVEGLGSQLADMQVRLHFAPTITLLCDIPDPLSLPSLLHCPSDSG